MSKYVELDKIKQFPIRRDHYDRENGSEEFINGIESVMEYIEQLPTVEGLQGWISCKERMPKFPSVSLWVDRMGRPVIPRTTSGKKLTLNDGPWQDGYIVCSKSGRVFYSTWYASNKMSAPHWTTKAEVIAWMALPKPYTEERESNGFDS